MDVALERLRTCHAGTNCIRSSSLVCSRRGNSNGSNSSGTLGAKLAPPPLAAAATAPATEPPPLTISQRALLRRARSAHRSNQQQQRELGSGAASPAAAAQLYAPPTAPPREQHHHHQQLSPQELRRHGELLQLRMADAPASEFQALMERHNRMQQQQQAQQQAQRPREHPAALPPPLPSLQKQQQHVAAAGSISSPAEQLAQTQLLSRHLQLRQLLAAQAQRKRRLQLQLRSEPAVLTSLIKRASSWQRLEQLFGSFAPLFNPIHVAAALTHLAQLQGAPLSPAALASAPPGMRALVRQLASAAVACAPDFGPRQLANCLWALARLGAGGLLPRRVRSDLLASLQERLQGAAPQHVANAAAAVATMGWPTSTRWRASLLQAAGARLPHFQPGELAMLLHALPRLQAAPSRAWLDGALAAAAQQAYSFSLQELAMLGASLVRLQQAPPPRQWLLRYLHAVHLKLLPHAMPQDTSSADAADAAADGSSEQSEAAAAGSAAAAAHGLVSVLWVLAVWQAELPGEWRSCCLAAAEQLAGSFCIQGASTLLWALGKLSVQPQPALVDKLLQHSRPLLPQANCTDLAMLAWGLGAAGVTAAGLRQQELAAGVSSSSGGGAGWVAEFVRCSHRALPGASASDVVTLLVGLQRMRVTPGPRYLAAVSVEAHHHLHELRPSELAATLLSLARWHHTPTASFMATFLAASQAALVDTAAALSSGQPPPARQQQQQQAAKLQDGAVLFNPQALANMLGALAMLDWRPSAAWCADFLAATATLLPRCSGRDFAHIAWGLARLGVQPPQAWMRAFLAALRRHVPAMSSQQLSAVVWGLAHLHHRPRGQAMRRFLERVRDAAPHHQQQQQHAVPEEVSEESLLGAVVAPPPVGGGALAAPPSQLQLSGFFSLIVLQGLTVWASERAALEDDEDEDDDGDEGTQQEAAGAAAAYGGDAHDGGAHHQLAAHPCRVEPSSRVRTSVAADGCTVYHF